MTEEVGPNNYVTRVFEVPAALDKDAWNGLLALEVETSPFMRHEFFTALHESESACASTGWRPSFLTLWTGDRLEAACPLFHKSHSYGEYVFDWSWADAYHQHGLRYYPKGLVAVPFTPVPGARLLARDASARRALAHALIRHAADERLSSLHLLYISGADIAAVEAAGYLLRQGVQFHWNNDNYLNFEHFLSSLQQVKRKKIRQERRKVEDAGVRFRHLRGTEITASEWDFFYRCYERTYLDHGHSPYLNREFFRLVGDSMAEDWLMFVAERDGVPLASSLIGIDMSAKVAYGRYWGTLEPLDSLHFDTCYYQPLQWCIDHGFRRFEGGAQGEHKMARALLPVRTTSAHWLAHPAFAEAIQRHLEHEAPQVEAYLGHLKQRSPLKSRNEA